MEGSKLGSTAALAVVLVLSISSMSVTWYCISEIAVLKVRVERLEFESSDKGNTISQLLDQLGVEPSYYQRDDAGKEIPGHRRKVRQLLDLSGTIAEIVRTELEAHLNCSTDAVKCTIEPGPKGDPGPSGPPGPKGETGDQGQKGAIGYPGVGLRGTKGAKGVKGQRGRAGLNGQKGEVGERGEKGSPGITGPVGAMGVQGPPGPRGEKGDMGTRGPVGEKGERGDPGLSGVKGERGNPGLSGVKGERGDPGLSGIKGERGNPGLGGVKGERGDPGLSGEKGERGDPGLSGLKGERGNPGLSGVKGERGDSGLSGVKGEKGDPGLSGLKGEKGDQGIPGAQGSEGEPKQKGGEGDTPAGVYSFSCGGTSGWARVANLNMTNGSHQCSGDMVEATLSGKRLCGRADSANMNCVSANFSTSGLQYSQVCGRITGYQYGVAAAFHFYTEYHVQSIESWYVDGVSLTHGPSDNKKHVWTFATGYSENGYNVEKTALCPCSPNAAATIRVPPFVGQDYFCESGLPTGSAYSQQLLPDDPLWDGDGCRTGSTCCEFNNPPYFTKQLDSPTTDDLEVRACGYYSRSGTYRGDTLIELIQLYIK